MLDAQHSSFLQNQLSNEAARQHEMVMEKLVTEAEYSLVEMLKPKIYKDGNSWCVLYGENIHSGISGFGETPYKAVLAFNKAWNQN